MPQLPHVPPAPSPPQDLPAQPNGLVVGVGVWVDCTTRFVGSGVLLGGIGDGVGVLLGVAVGVLVDAGGGVFEGVGVGVLSVQLPATQVRLGPTREHIFEQL